MLKMFSNILSVVLLLLSCLPSVGQISRKELEDINRYKDTKQETPLQTDIIQSLDETPTENAFTTLAPSLDMWSFAGEEEDTGYNVTASTKDADVLRMRLESLPEEFIVPWNAVLESQVYNYLTRHPKALGTILGKYNHYRKLMEAAFRTHKLPPELSALAMVESAMNPTAKSNAGALGLWQFMPGTAKKFGLRCDYLVDERLDMSKSTYAAAKYLKSAYKHFGSWPLAISSYNCGIQNVDKAIEKAGSKNFWDVYDYLPKETKGYLPAYLAALVSLYYQQEYEIPDKPYRPQGYTVFKVTENITYSRIMRATDISQQELINLNPQYVAGVIPGSENSHTY